MPPPMIRKSARIFACRPRGIGTGPCRACCCGSSATDASKDSMATRAPLHAVPFAAPDFLSHPVQSVLARWNRERLSPGLPDPDWEEGLEREQRMRRLEGGFVEALRADVGESAAQAPCDPKGFLAWYEGLREEGPGQGDKLFLWLAEEAPLEAMRWFLEQEAAGEAGFDDLVAMTQVKFPMCAKLELARNYWDEMGRGNPKGMHGPMLDFLVERLPPPPPLQTTSWPNPPRPHP